MPYFKRKEYHVAENLWKDIFLGFLPRGENLAGAENLDFRNL